MRINIDLSDEIGNKFRDVVYKRYGMKKGNLTKAIEEAILEWIK